MTEAQDDTIKAQMAGHWTLDDERWIGHKREHELLDRATDVAAVSLDKRIGALNEFRAQLSDQSKTFVTRDLYDKLEEQMVRRFTDTGKYTDERYEANRRRIELLEKGDVKQEGKGLGQAATIAAIISAVSFAGVVIALLLNVVHLVGT